MEKIESLKNIFSHGDLHPLNVLWGPNFIKYVIDWEFSGYKPEVYDLANLIGCLGIEHPTALGGPLTSEFIKYIKQHHIVTDNGWQALPGMILANRFAWLSEWLRKNDHEMILMELDYFDLLMEHHEDMVHFFTELSF